MESFATRLRTAMNARHLRQVDIVRAAQASGVKLGKSHISQYVSGKTTPRADTLRFLADTLQVDEQSRRPGRRATHAIIPSARTPDNVTITRTGRNTHAPLQQIHQT